MPTIVGRPTCAKCKKPVDRMVRSTDPASGDFIFDVFCHGSTDRTILSYNQVADMDKDTLIEAIDAFTMEALTDDSSTADRGRAA